MVDMWVRGKAVYMVTEWGASITHRTLPPLTPRPDPPILHHHTAEHAWSLPTLAHRSIRYHRVSHPGSWKPPSRDPGFTQINLVGELTPADEEEIGGIVFVQTTETPSGVQDPPPPRLLPTPLSTSPPGSFMSTLDRGATQIPFHIHSRSHLLQSNSSPGLLTTIEVVATQHRQSESILMKLRAYPLDGTGKLLNGGRPVELQVPTNIPWEHKFGRIRTTNEPCAVTGTFLVSCKGTSRATGSLRTQYTARVWLLNFE